MPQTRLSLLFSPAVLALAALLIGGCGHAVYGTGTLAGRDGLGNPAEPAFLRIDRTEQTRNPKVVTSGGPLQDLTGVGLRMRRLNTPPFQETFHLVALSRAASRPGSDDPQPTVASDDPSFVPNNTGDLVYLRVNAAAPRDTFSTFGPASIRPAGSAWMVREDSEDRSIPWVIAAGGAAPCFPMGGGDCFDMQTLARLFLTSAATATETAVAGINPQTPIGTLPVISVTGHRLAFVPNVAFTGVPPRTQGFMFIYSADLSVPFGNATVFVPLSLFFLPDTDPSTYTTAIDPLSTPFLAAPWQNPARIRVEAEGVLGPFAGIIRDAVRSGITSATLPAPAGIPIETLLATAVAGVIGAGGAPPDFDVALLPETPTDEATVRTDILTTPTAAAVPTDVLPVRLVFLEN